MPVDKNLTSSDLCKFAIRCIIAICKVHKNGLGIKWTYIYFMYIIYVFEFNVYQ